MARALGVHVPLEFAGPAFLVQFALEFFGLVEALFQAAGDFILLGAVAGELLRLLAKLLLQAIHLRPHGGQHRLLAFEHCGSFEQLLGDPFLIALLFREPLGFFLQANLPAIEEVRLLLEFLSVAAQLFVAVIDFLILGLQRLLLLVQLDLHAIEADEIGLITGLELLRDVGVDDGLVELRFAGGEGAFADLEFGQLRLGGLHPGHEITDLRFDLSLAVLHLNVQVLHLPRFALHLLLHLRQRLAFALDVGFLLGALALDFLAAAIPDHAVRFEFARLLLELPLLLAKLRHVLLMLLPDIRVWRGLWMGRVGRVLRRRDRHEGNARRRHRLRLRQR